MDDITFDSQELEYSTDEVGSPMAYHMGEQRNFAYNINQLIYSGGQINMLPFVKYGLSKEPETIQLK